jgi:hypothetical protein
MLKAADPDARLAESQARIPDTKNTRLDDLLP